MTRLLHIVATPRGKESRTLKVTETFLDTIKKKHADLEIDTLNVFKEDLLSLTSVNLEGKYVLLGGGSLDSKLKKEWKGIEAEIERFLKADIYVISAPMWNFGIPYRLKQYIDIITQPKYLFQYTDKGVEGLAKNKRMVVITSRGGDYSGADAKAFDRQEPYLRTVFGFVGITDIKFINAQPMDAMGEEVRNKKIAEAQDAARDLANAI